MRSGKKFTLGFLPTLFCLVALLIAGCGQGSGGGSGSAQPTAAPDSAQVLRYSDNIAGNDIATMDPGQVQDLPSIEAILMVYTGLVQWNDQLQITPELAKSWDVSSDGLTYTFHMKTGLKFSDGTTLNANDVAYSIDRALSPAVSSLNSVTQTYLGLIKDSDKRISGKMPSLINDSIKVIDDNTISLTTNKKTAYFLDALTYPTSYVVEKKVIDQWGLKFTDHLGDNGGQGGSGPFKVLSYSHTTGLVFVPNTNYYGPAPRLKRVEFNFNKTADSAYAAYGANQADISQPPAALIPQAETLPNNQFHRFSELAIDYIAMNYLAKPFDNIHIRQAFELAINKDAIMKGVFHSIYTPTCHIVPQGQPGYNPNLQCAAGAPTSGDQAKAKALFQQGLQEENLTAATLPPIKITYSANSTSAANEVTLMRQMWQSALGVNVATQTLDFAPLINAENQTACTQADVTKCLNKGLQMWVQAWGADYPDPQDWLTLQFDKGAPNNQWNYGQNLSSAATAQQQIQQQLEQADGDLNATTRMQTYNTAEQQLINDVAWAPLDQRNGAWVLKPYVVGMTFNALDERPAADWANIYIAAH